MPNYPVTFSQSMQLFLNIFYSFANLDHCVCNNLVFRSQKHFNKRLMSYARNHLVSGKKLRAWCMKITFSCWNTSYLSNRLNCKSALCQCVDHSVNTTEDHIIVNRLEAELLIALFTRHLHMTSNESNDNICSLCLYVSVHRLFVISK